METIWGIVKNCINSRQIDSVITRKELLEEVEKIFYNRRKDYWGNFNGENRFKPFYSPVTIDCFRNMSTGLGYLSKTKRNGIYIVKIHFPEDMTSSRLRGDYDMLNSFIAKF
jgi:hypothetical protein